MTKAIEKHYVTFYSPGTFTPEISDAPVDAWDPKLAVAAAERIVERHGAKPYAFVFETRLEMPPVDDGRGGTLKVQPRTAAKSSMYFLGGRVETFDEVVARADPKEEILRTNLEGNRIPLVIVNTNSYRSVLAFEEGHLVVDASGEVIERGDDPKWKAYRAERIAGWEMPGKPEGGPDGR